MAQKKTSNPIMAIVPIAVIIGAGFYTVKTLKHPSVPLEDALEKRDMPTISAWVDHGINYDKAMFADQYTPLYYAAMEEMAPTVHSFLEHGANPNAPNPNGTTPLMVACDTMNVDMVKDLLDHNADVNIRTKEGEAALDDAVKASAGSAAIFKNRPKEFMAKMAKQAVEDGLKADVKREKIVKMLVDKKVDPNGGGYRGVPVLMRVGSHSIMAMLVNAGAKLDAQDKLQGRTLLFAPAMDKDLAEKVIAAKIDVNAKTKTGETALMDCSDPDVAAVLIAHGADVNATDAVNMTPLYHAVLGGSKKKMELLLQHGAKFDVKAKDTKLTLMEAAARCLDPGVVSILVAHGGKAVAYTRPVIKPGKVGGGGGAGGG